MAIAWETFPTWTAPQVTPARNLLFMGSRTALFGVPQHEALSGVDSGGNWAG